MFQLFSSQNKHGNGQQSAHERSSLEVMLNRGRPSASRLPSVMPVNITMIGREHAGKTALWTAAESVLLGDFLPSGLQVCAMGENGVEMSPLVLNKRVSQLYQRLKLLATCGLPTTLVPKPMNFVLCEGEQPRLQLLGNDEIGQVISQSSVDSLPEDLVKYRESLQRMAQAHVLWIVVSPPPRQPGSLADLQWKKDLMQYRGFLDEALRSSPGPVALGVILNKVDSLFDSEAEALDTLSDTFLKDALRSLVRALEMSQKVSYAAIFPTSSFGFGQSMVHQADEPADFESDDSDEGNWLPDARHHETEFVMRPDASFQPFNLKPLVVWSLLAGALPQEIEFTRGADEPALARTCNMLSQDLAELDGWIIPIKGNLLS